MVSGPWAPPDVEQRANAFAAMLLMPEVLVQKAKASLSVALETVEGILSMAGSLRVSFTALLRHLCNLRMIDEAIKDGIEDEVFGLEQNRDM